MVVIDEHQRLAVHIDIRSLSVSDPTLSVGGNQNPDVSIEAGQLIDNIAPFGSWSVPGGTRTRDLKLRRLALFPG